MAQPKPLTEEEANRFQFHPATSTTGPQHDLVRSLIQQCADDVAALVPDGRHRSMALTSLQEAMWAANAGIACDSDA